MTFLSQLRPGQSAVVDGLEAGNPTYRAKLLAMGVTPGTLMTVVRCAPMGDPIEVSLRGYRLSLRRAEAAVIRTRATAEAFSQRELPLPA